MWWNNNEAWAEAKRRRPTDEMRPSEDAGAHYRVGFQDGAEWAAGKAEQKLKNIAAFNGGLKEGLEENPEGNEVVFAITHILDILLEGAGTDE